MLAISIFAFSLSNLQLSKVCCLQFITFFLVQGGDYNNGGKRTIYDGNRKQAMVIQGHTCNVQSFSDVIMDADSVYNPTLFTTGNEFFRFGAGFSPKFAGKVSSE